MCTVRRFYFTEKWRIGVGSRLLGPGDKAYLLLQARSLLTLRACKPGNPKAGFSTDIVLLGYAYVYELVHGEARDLTERFPHEVINIY